MRPTQGIKINKSIIDYFKMVMDFDNESSEYCEITEREFKKELEKALQTETVATLVIKWVGL